MSYDPKVSGDFEAAQRRLKDCIAKIKVWMLCNKLRLNESTQF